MLLGDRRSSFEIITEILRLLRLGDTRKTQMMYSVRLSYRLRQRYLQRLLQLGVVDEIAQDAYSPVYRITGKGLTLLAAIEDLQEMLRPDELRSILDVPMTTEPVTR